MANYKIMPNNLDAEQAVLGCLLIDSECQTELMYVLKATDFYTDAHKTVFEAMQKVFLRNIPIDFITLTEELEREGKINAIGGLDYISFLSNVVPSAANYKYYADIVKSNALRRQLIQSGQSIIEKAYSDEDKDDIMAFAEGQVFAISEKEESSALEHVGKPNGAIKQVIDKFDKISKDPDSLRGIPTGYKDLDEITNGIQLSDLILLAARPSVGKTSFAMNLVVNIALSGKTCAVFSLEMPKTQLMQRAICSVAKVPMGKALAGQMNIDEWKRVWAATKQLENCELYVDDSSLTTPAQLLSKCRRLKAKQGKLDLVMIDYLQLMTPDRKSKDGNRQGEISEITRNLKIAAKELNVPIIVLSQLSRDIEKREGHLPQLSDLRESGSIEQDADIVMFLHNPEKYNDIPAQEEPGIVELHLAKHRNGQIGIIKLRWIGQYTTFVGLEEKVSYQKESKKEDISEETALTEIEGYDFEEEENE